MKYKIFVFEMSDHRGNGKYVEQEGVELRGKTKEELTVSLQKRFDTFHVKKPYIVFI